MTIAKVYKLPSMDLVTDCSELDDSSVYGMILNMVQDASYDCELLYNYVYKNPDKQFFEVWNV